MNKNIKEVVESINKLSTKNLNELLKLLNEDIIEEVDNEKYTKEEIKTWLDEMEIRNYKVNEDLTVDVDESINLNNRNLTEIPIQFGIVDGSFYCSDTNLASLEGFPEIVIGDVDCRYNNLESLEYAPEIVKGNFECNHNKLKTLKGSPKEISGDFYCNDNKLTSLEGSPRECENFVCINNPKLTYKYLNNYDFSFIKEKLYTDYEDINDKWNK